MIVIQSPVACRRPVYATALDDPCATINAASTTARCRALQCLSAHVQRQRSHQDQTVGHGGVASPPHHGNEQQSPAAPTSSPPRTEVTRIRVPCAAVTLPAAADNEKTRNNVRAVRR